MKKIEKIASALVGAGILGAIICAGSLETSTASFVISEAICMAIAAFGAWLGNRTAEAEAPAANTMKRGTTRNS